MNDPRIPNLRGVMQAKSKPLASERVADVPAPRVTTLGYEPLPQRAPGVRLDGEPAEQAADLVRRLEGEARVL
jgi:electron transfer flavoprotein beta subunit